MTIPLGSTALTLNADVTLKGELRYSALGETRFSEGVTPTTFAYTGHLPAISTTRAG